MKNTFFNLLIFLLVFPFTGCEKEDSCNGDEPFVEPAWVKTIQNEYEEDSFICSSDMRLFRWNNQYFIAQRILVDTTWSIYHTLYDCKGNIVEDTKTIEQIQNLSDNLEALDRIWYYFNPSCSWVPGLNSDCGELESDPKKVLPGKWKRTATILSETGTTENKIPEYHFTYPIYFEFKPGGEMVMEFYSGYHNRTVKNEGNYKIDSLLKLEFSNTELSISYPRNWTYAFSYCNNSLKIKYDGLPANREDIYIRQE